jgi:2,3-bisphosphoglycerate-dependent phosphoglycerate mutase
VELTALGKSEASAAGTLMKAEGLVFDFAHTSLLTRAVRTCNLALEAMDQMWLPLQRHWRLNERHYGALQGLDKKATTELHGAEQTNLWRRSYDIPPPPVDTTSPEHPVSDARYRFIAPQDLPATECLKDVVARVLPYWNTEIVPQLQANMNVLVVAHGNSLRALIMYLESISEAAIAELNVPTGVPRKYTFTSSMEVSDSTYLGDADAIAQAAAAVANQSK